MTNHWNDLKNSDCIMAIGCNPAENHPISFKWIEAATGERGNADRRRSPLHPDRIQG